MKNLGNKKGFTWLDLLVIIAVVGVLSGIILQGINFIRQKSRDNTRKAELKELQAAITHYFTMNNSYPSTDGVWLSSEIGDTCNGGCSHNENYIPSIVAAKIISSLPKDPLGGVNLNGVCVGTQHRAFVYKSDGQHYKLLSNCSLEKGSYPVVGTQFYDPFRPTWALQVTDNYAATAIW